VQTCALPIFALAVPVAFVVAAATLGTLGLVALVVLVLHDQRLLGHRIVALHHQVAEDGVVEAEALDQLVEHGLVALDVEQDVVGLEDRKSTRLNSSHVKISYAVFCLKKKTRK